MMDQLRNSFPFLDGSGCLPIIYAWILKSITLYMMTAGGAGGGEKLAVKGCCRDQSVAQCFGFFKKLCQIITQVTSLKSLFDRWVVSPIFNCHIFIHKVKLATLVFLQLVLVKHSQEWQITFYDGKSHSMSLQYYPNSTYLLQMVHSEGNPDDVIAT